MALPAFGADTDSAPDVRATDHPIVVVVRDDWDALESISLPALRQVYLGRRTDLAGERVVCFDLAPGSPVRSGFGRAVLQKSAADLRRHWVEQALSGGHPPPREVSSAEEMLRAVARRRGAIGYLDYATFQSLQSAGVRALPVGVGHEPLPPSAAMYPIRYVGATAR